MIKNYYKILGVNPKSSPEDIKISFRKLAIFWHPDRNSNPIALEKMQELNEANQILSDEKKRLLYDRLYYEFYGNDYSNEIKITKPKTTTTNKFDLNEQKEKEESLSKKYEQEISELNSWIKNIKFSLSSFDNLLNKGLEKIDRPIENFVYYFPIVLGVIFLIVIILLNLSK